jgi:hypothetical protein
MALPSLILFSVNLAAKEVSSCSEGASSTICCQHGSCIVDIRNAFIQYQRLQPVCIQPHRLDRIRRSAKASYNFWISTQGETFLFYCLKDLNKFSYIVSMSSGWKNS